MRTIVRYANARRLLRSNAHEKTTHITEEDGKR